RLHYARCLPALDVPGFGYFGCSRRPYLALSGPLEGVLFGVATIA
ncbi:hypothetical protein A2U01_0108730, partial [Trifolium medium]|nr:hypothetical protein [Trifolium medium]